jgi:hypothetical protein
MTGLLQSMNLEPVPRPQESDGDGLPNVLLLATLGAGEEEQGSYPSGKPRNARDLLLAGVQDVTQMRASGGTRSTTWCWPCWRRCTRQWASASPPWS